MPELTVAERLKNIGIASDRDLEDLHVDAGETLDLDPRNDRFSGNIERIRFGSIKDVKQFMGIPDDAFEKTDVKIRPEVTERPVLGERLPLARRIPSLVINTPELQDATITKRFYDMSADLVFGDSRRFDPRQIEAVDSWIQKIKINIPIFLFRDIFVAKGATLNVKSTALFANHITVENTGRIKFKSGAHSTLHVARFTGL